MKEMLGEDEEDFDVSGPILQGDSGRLYSVKQTDRNRSKTDIFHKPTTYKQHA